MKRTVIITGGTKGLGREISIEFGRAGYFVIALYGSDVAAAMELEKLLAGEGIEGCAINHDISQESGMVWSHPEIQNAESLTLIHCACPSFIPSPMHQVRWLDVERQIAVGVKGAWLCWQALVRPMLKKRRCTLVNVLTAAVEGTPPKGFSAYAIAKHALLGFTLAVASEYAARGIRVFSVAPGFMDTPLTAGWDSRLREAIASGSNRTVPTFAAKRILALVEDEGCPGLGENYPV